MKKCRKFTPEFKAQATLEVLMGVKYSTEACREYSLKPEILSRWKAELVENAHLVFRSNEQQIPRITVQTPIKKPKGQELTDEQKAFICVSRSLS